MKKYAKVVNEETKLCEVGVGTNTSFYASIGMSEIEVEQAYDGQWYLKGYAPEKPIEQCEAEIRAVRNQYLEQTDKYMITDYPITDDERELYKQYRVYLRDYTLSENWWEHSPKDFSTWKEMLTEEEWNKPKEPDTSEPQEEAGI